MREVACSDCVVTTLLARPATVGMTPVNRMSEVSEGTVEAIELLSSRGIVRPMRFLRAVQG